MRLLIADDERVIRQGLLSLDWQSIGIEAVYAARDGTEAKALLARERIDIILSDIRMPGMDGLELAAYINTHAMDIAVVLLTGFAQFDYALEALQHRVCNYLLKPAPRNPRISSGRLRRLETSCFCSADRRRYLKPVGIWLMWGRCDGNCFIPFLAPGGK